MPKTILVVDSHRDSRLLLSIGLKKRGHQVVEADSAESALKVIGKVPVAAVITDIKLLSTPNGLGLARVLRRLYPDIPYIVTTTGDTSDSEAQGVGAVRLFRKPLNVQEVIQSVETTLQL